MYYYLMFDFSQTVQQIRNKNLISSLHLKGILRFLLKLKSILRSFKIHTRVDKSTHLFNPKAVRSMQFVLKRYSTKFIQEIMDL